MLQFIKISLNRFIIHLLLRTIFPFDIVRLMELSKSYEAVGMHQRFMAVSDTKRETCLHIPLYGNINCFKESEVCSWYRKE
jgi:hypothetical protein